MELALLQMYVIVRLDIMAVGAKLTTASALYTTLHLSALQTEHVLPQIHVIVKQVTMELAVRHSTVMVHYSTPLPFVLVTVHVTRVIVVFVNLVTMALAVRHSTAEDCYLILPLYVLQTEHVHLPEFVLANMDTLVLTVKHTPVMEHFLTPPQFALVTVRVSHPTLVNVTMDTLGINVANGIASVINVRVMEHAMLLINVGVIRDSTGNNAKPGLVVVSCSTQQMFVLVMEPALHRTLVHANLVSMVPTASCITVEELLTITQLYAQEMEHALELTNATARVDTMALDANHLIVTERDSTPRTFAR